MIRRLVVLLLLAACTTQASEGAPSVGEGTTVATLAVSTTSTTPTTTLPATTTTDPAPTSTVASTTTQPPSAPVGERPTEFPVCPSLPSPLGIVAGVVDADGTFTYPDGSPVVFFDLRASAEVDTYKVRVLPDEFIVGQHRDGMTHYVLAGDSPAIEFIVDPGFGFWVWDGATWAELGVEPFLVMPLVYVDPTFVYARALDALEAMELVRWEVAEGRWVAVFIGGPEGHAGFDGRTEVGSADEGATIEIWMSPACYPVQVHIKAPAGRHVEWSWELFDLGQPVDFDGPIPVGGDPGG